MSDRELRKKLIRLAHSKPELGSELIPLLKQGSDPLTRIRQLIHDSPSVDRDNEIVEIRSENPRLQDIIDDYLKGHKFNPGYLASVSSETWRVYEDGAPEMIDGGWDYEDEEFDSLGELVWDVRHDGHWTEWSSSSPGPRDWIISHGEKDWRTGDSTDHSLFIERIDKKPLSREEITYITNSLLPRRRQ